MLWHRAWPLSFGHLSCVIICYAWPISFPFLSSFFSRVAHIFHVLWGVVFLGGIVFAWIVKSAFEICESFDVYSQSFLAPFVLMHWLVGLACLKTYCSFSPALLLGRNFTTEALPRQTFVSLNFVRVVCVFRTCSQQATLKLSALVCLVIND